MGNKEMPAHRSPAGWVRAYGNWSGWTLPHWQWAAQLRISQAWIESLSDPMLYVVVAMIGFILAIDAYILVHTV